MDCNQNLIPLIFLHDVNGFMVGRDAEWSGIIKAGAKMVNAVSNSIVPKITVILGGSFGAGHYAMCGKAYDPRFLFAWPTAKYAVMSGDSAAGTLVEIKIRQLERGGKQLSEEEKKGLARAEEPHAGGFSTVAVLGSLEHLVPGCHGAGSAADPGAAVAAQPTAIPGDDPRREHARPRARRADDPHG